MTNKVADTTRAHRESIVNEHIDAEAVRHDVAATVKTFKHPRYEVPALDTVADGRRQSLSGRRGPSEASA